jgi:hypothetical protein
MRKWLLPLLAGTLYAATIRGTVVENLTGRALAHASVLLEPVPGSSGTRMSARTDRYGLFEFSGAPAGMYLLQATRTPYLTAYYGQKRWNSAGIPFTVTDSENPFLTIRMMRFAAIAGRVVDENEVGQPEFEVAAYRNTRPLQLVANASADERGVYRISGLLPGSYLVRSVGKQLEGTAYKPTFGHETEAVDEARPVDVEMEQEVREANIRPLPGQLFSLSVEANPTDPEKMPVTMMLVSEMNRQTVNGETHTFTGLPRGDYEVFAEAPTETAGVKQAAYQRVSIGKDTGITMPMRRISPVYFEFEGLATQASGDGTVKVLGRRKDLAGSHDPQVIKIENHHANLTVGPWEFAVEPLDGYYVSGFSAPGPYRSNKRVEGWNEAFIGGGGTVRFTLSASHASVHGAVSDLGSAVIGAPVFLELMDLEAARRVTDTYVTITDVHGQYRFAGLAPGRYRVLSSFEYRMPDSKTMADCGAKELQMDARTDIARDLDLYVIR